jgi:hypothetical protein
VWGGARHGRVVSRASAKISAGKMEVSRRASIDSPAPRGPISRILWSERLHSLRVRLDLHAYPKPCGRWSAAARVMHQPPRLADGLIGLDEDVGGSSAPGPGRS